MSLRLSVGGKPLPADTLTVTEVSASGPLKGLMAHDVAAVRAVVVSGQELVEADRGAAKMWLMELAGHTVTVHKSPG